MTLLTITRHDDPPDTMTISFDPPISFKGGEVVQLDLQEPTGKQVREAERVYTVEAPWASQSNYELKLIGFVSKLSDAATEALPIGAVNYAMAFLQEFVEGNEPEETDEDPVAPEPITLTIDPPIKFNGAVYTDLELREPRASEIRSSRMLMRTPGSLFELRRSQMHLVSSVSGLPPPVIDALKISLLNTASRHLGRFTTAGRKTGKR